MKRPRRNHEATFKAQVVLAAVNGEKTLAELAEQFSDHSWLARYLTFYNQVRPHRAL